MIFVPSPASSHASLKRFARYPTKSHKFLTISRISLTVFLPVPFCHTSPNDLPILFISADNSSKANLKLSMTPLPYLFQLSVTGLNSSFNFFSISSVSFFKPFKKSYCGKSISPIPAPPPIPPPPDPPPEPPLSESFFGLLRMFNSSNPNVCSSFFRSFTFLVAPPTDEPASLALSAMSSIAPEPFSKPL